MSKAAGSWLRAAVLETTTTTQEQQQWISPSLLTFAVFEIEKLNIHPKMGL